MTCLHLHCRFQAPGPQQLLRLYWRLGPQTLTLSWAQDVVASVEAAGASLATVRAELARTPPAVAVDLAADTGAGGDSGRVRLQLRAEPFHEALVATQQARPCLFNCDTSVSLITSGTSAACLWCCG